MRPLASGTVLALGMAPTMVFALGVEDYVPASAAGMVVWRNPLATLSRIEDALCAAGVCPPGAASGWIVKPLKANEVWLEGVDLSRPVAVAILETDGGDLRPIIALHRKAASDPLIRTRTDNPFRLVAHEDVILMVDEHLGSGHESPSEERYEPDEVALKLAATDDIFVHLDGGKLLAASDAGWLKDLIYTSTYLRLDETTSLTLSLRVASGGVLLRYLEQYRPNSDAARRAASLRNTDTPLIQGLPAQDYFAVLGWRLGSAALVREAIMDFVSRMVELTTEDGDDPTDRATVQQLEQLPSVFEDKFRRGQRWVLGLAMPEDVASLSLVGWTSGRKKKTNALISSLAEWLNTLLVTMAKDVDYDDPVVLRPAPAPLKVEGAELRGYRLDGGLVRERPEFQRSQAAFLSGTAGRTTVMSWNAPPAVLEELVRRTESDVLSDAKFSQARAELPDSRFAEIFLDVEPIATALTSGQGPTASTTPAAGIAFSKMEGGWRSDLFLPFEALSAAVPLFMRFAQLRSSTSGIEEATVWRRDESTPVFTVESTEDGASFVTGGMLVGFNYQNLNQVHFRVQPLLFAYMLRRDFSLGLVRVGVTSVWKQNAGDRVYLYLDGEPVAPLRVVSSDHAVRDDGKVLENVIVDVPVAIVHRIAASKSIELTVASTILRIPELQPLMRQFLDALQASTGQPANAPATRSQDPDRTGPTP